MSSQPQATADKISIPEQLGQNRSHAEKHGGTIVAELVIPGKSRSIDTWEEACTRIDAYAQLNTLLSERAIDVLAFYDATRLGRTASLVATVRQLCITAGVALYETTNPPNEIASAWRYDDALIGAIKSVGAQQEIEKLVERRRIGMKSRVRQGHLPGNINFGYKKLYTPAGEPYLIADEAEAETVRMIFELYLQGRGGPYIRDRLNKLNRSTQRGGPWVVGSVQAVVQHVWIYAGYVVYNQNGYRVGTPDRFKGNHPSIIDDALAEIIAQEIESRAHNHKLADSEMRFAGVCLCAECGMPLKYGKNSASGESYLRLSCARHKPNVSIKEAQVGPALEEFLKSIKTDKVKLSSRSNAQSSLMRSLAIIDREIAAIEKSLIRADDAYVSGQMTESRYQSQITRINERAVELAQQRARNEEQLADEAERAEQTARFTDVRQHGLTMLRSDDVLTTNIWLRRYVRIYCSHKKIDAIVLL